MFGGSTYVSNTVDPNSANIINNLLAAHGGSVVLDVNGSTTSVSQDDAPVNLAQSTTTMYTVSAANGFYNDPWNDDPLEQMPWNTSSFSGQNNCTTATTTNGHGNGNGGGGGGGGGGGDCHTIVMTGPTGFPAGTGPCLDYETYSHGDTISGTTFTTQYFSVHNLSQAYNNQIQSIGGVTEAQIPLLGTADVGQDASAPSINHIAYMVLPGPVGVAEQGFVTPAGAGPACTSFCSYPIPMGARLRLNPARYTCPSAATNPQANKICVQLETYGMIVADQTGAINLFVVPVGPNPDGTNPWNAADLNAISSTGGNGIPLQDFDVMTLGPVTP